MHALQSNASPRAFVRRFRERALYPARFAERLASLPYIYHLLEGNLEKCVFNTSLFYFSIFLVIVEAG
jgi:hypothetical protein